MKDGIRILGVDDASFSHSDSFTSLTGVVYRGTEFIEDIKTVGIDVDGNDSAEKVVKLFETCQNTTQIKAVLLDGVCLAGFNFVDIEKVSEEIDRPVITVTSNKPDREKFVEAMKKSGNYDSRIKSMLKAKKIELDEGISYIQYSGCSEPEAKQYVEKSVINGLMPEPIRVADFIGNVLPVNSNS